MIMIYQLVINKNMKYNNAIITEEDFRRERERRDNEILERIKGRINSKWMGYVRGFDTDYIPNPPVGMNE